MMERTACWLGWLPMGVLGLAGAEPPVLETTREGADTVAVSVVGGTVEDGWILQHSYNGVNWWDLEAMDGKTTLYAVSSAPTATRGFRAAKKAPATNQEALTQARERWAAGGLANYQYRSQTSVSGFLTDDLTLVKDDEVVEWTSLLPPEFPNFLWGDQTIEDLFDRLQQAIDGGSHLMTVRYHPEWGYPETAYVDPSELIADEEWGVTITAAPSDPEGARAKAEHRWEQRRPQSYEFDLRYETARSSWEGTIRVVGGSAVVVAGGSPSRGHIVMTMQGYFAYIGAALSEGKVSSAAYHTDLGHPLFFSRDWHLTQADGPGERFWISGLRALKGP